MTIGELMNEKFLNSIKVIALIIMSRNPLDKAISDVKSSFSGIKPPVVNERIEGYASRKKGRLATIASFEEDFSHNKYDEDNQKELEISLWKEKFERLSDESNNKIQDLENTIITSNIRVEKIERYAFLLEKKVLSLETENEKIKKESENNKAIASKVSKSATKAASAAAALSNEAIQTNTIATEINKIYEKFTSMTIKPTSSTASTTTTPKSKSKPKFNEYMCTVTNAVKHISTRFLLQIPTDPKQNIDFIPKSNLDMLPEYLRVHISFEPLMAPVLMGDVLQSLYEDQEEEDEDDGGDNGKGK